MEPEPHPLWEYPCQPLSDAVNLMLCNVSQPVPENTQLRSEGSWPLCWANGHASCHAVVLWMDAVLSEGSIVSGGPSEVCVCVCMCVHVCVCLILYYLCVTSVPPSATTARMHSEVEHFPQAGCLLPPQFQRSRWGRGIFHGTLCALQTAL